MIDVDTPAVVVDVDRLQRNLERWQAHCDAVGLANRPHVKTHKSVEIARRQRALGASGITCQKLGEAEVMADVGLDDILIPYNVLGASKLERLGDAGRVRLAVSVDDERLLTGLADAVGRSRPLRVLVECDTGHGRAGVGTPEAAAALAASIGRHDGLSFGGFLTFPVLDGSLPFLVEAMRLAGRPGSRSRRCPSAGHRRCGPAATSGRRSRSTASGRTRSTIARRLRQGPRRSTRSR